jgi:hypothetical protein
MADADYRAALEKARKGDMEAMQIVRRAFDEKPERWRALGEIAWLARHCVVGAAAGKDLARVEAYMRRIAAQEAKIIGPDAPILERILAARIAVAWFEVCHLDAVVGQNANANARALEALDARRDRAHRRLRQSIRELAVLRRLTRPGAAVHVNAAMAQVNVRGTRGA